MENKNKNYLYFININQKAVIDNKWELNYNHVAILECIKCFSNSNRCQTMTDELGTWYWVKVSKIAQDLPLLGIKEQQIRKLIDKLVEYNLIELNPKNKIYQQFYLRLGSNIDKYLYTNSSTYIEKDSQPIYSGIYEPTYSSIEQPIYSSIDNYNIKDNNTKINKIKTNNISEKTNFSIPEHYSEFKEIWELWKKYKKEQHKFTYQAISEKASFDKLINLSNSNLNKAQKMLEIAISGGYKDFIELRDYSEKKSIKTAKNDKFTMEEVLLEKIGIMDTKAEGFDMFQVLK